MKATDAEWQELLSDFRTRKPPEKFERPDPLGVLLDLGLKVKVPVAGDVKVFGFQAMAPAEAAKARAFAREYAEAIKRQVNILDIFGGNYPGHCAGCKAFARDWPITVKGIRHTTWCLFHAYYLGKPHAPLKLEDEPTQPLINRGRCPRAKKGTPEQ